VGMVPAHPIGKSILMAARIQDITTQLDPAAPQDNIHTCLSSFLKIFGAPFLSLLAVSLGLLCADHIT
jgi:hypothetical protein